MEGFAIIALEGPALGYHAATMSRRPLEDYRSDEDAGSLEDDWIAEAEQDPADADWFIATIQALVAQGEPERAKSLAELWDSELTSRGLHAVRLDALRKTGTVTFKLSKLQREIVGTLEALYPAKPNLHAMVTYVGLAKAIDDPVKLWDRATKLQSLLVFDVGEIVAMQGYGVGRVIEVNLALETLKIDFEKRTGVTLGFRASAKMLKPLPPGHPLRLHLEDPERWRRLRESEPAEILRAVLESSDRALTGGEIRDALVGAIPDANWNSFWTAARKHPQVVTVGTGRQTYRWERSASSALDAVRTGFGRSEPRKKVEILRKSVERDPALAKEFAGDLASVAGEAETSDPGLAWELFFALERSGLLPSALDGLVDRLIAPEADLRRLLDGIEDRLLRERALAMVRERRADWVAVFRDQLLREADPRVLSMLADGLAASDRALLDRLLDDIVAQPRKAPAAFVWLAERAAEDELLRARSPLRLIQQLIAALGSEEFAPFRTRLRPLVESGGTLPRLFSHLGEEHAQAALEALLRSTALEPYHRDPLANALRLRFSALREEESGGPLYSTAAAIAEKRTELKRLAEVEIPANRKAIEEARAMGDLRENFEYKSARQRHEYLNARVAALHRDLGRARPIEFGRLDMSVVRIGARVSLIALDGRERSFSILGPWDSSPEDGIISYESELGKRLLGAKPGDEVSVGESKLRVGSIQAALET